MNPATIKRSAGGLALTAVAIAFIVLAMGRFSGRGGGPPQRPAVTIVVVRDTTVAIRAGESRQFEFRLPDRVCTLLGRIEGAAGDNREFEALVLNDDEFRKWPAVHPAGSPSSGRRKIWTPQVTLVGPGRFHLVIDNAGPPLDAGEVSVNAKAVCP